MTDDDEDLLRAGFAFDPERPDPVDAGGVERGNADGRRGDSIVWERCVRVFGTARMNSFARDAAGRDGAGGVGRGDGEEARLEVGDELLVAADVAEFVHMHV